MEHNAPSLDLSSIILFWKKSRKVDHASWIDTELIWNLIFPRTAVKLNSSNKADETISQMQLAAIGSGDAEFEDRESLIAALDKDGSSLNDGRVRITLFEAGSGRGEGGDRGFLNFFGWKFLWRIFFQSYWHK